jgi:hypothetical protein
MVYKGNCRVSHTAHDLLDTKANSKRLGGLALYYYRNHLLGNLNTLYTAAPFIHRKKDISGYLLPQRSEMLNITKNLLFASILSSIQFTCL